MIAVDVLEELSLLQPLGLRFWDEPTQSFVDDGLEVTAWPAASPYITVDATLNRSSVYSFRGLPGMRTAERGSGDDAFWAANPPFFDFVVQVLDPPGRFLPFQIQLQGPVRGIYRFPGTPADRANSIPVYSSPARIVPRNLAVLRAQLFDALNQQPAAWAAIDVSAPGQPIARGMADQQGRVMVPFPYPEPQNFGIGSPLGPGGIPLQDQSWPITIAVSYTPGLATDVPNLTQVLSQAPATVWADAGLSQPFSGANLQFGVDLTLRSWQMPGSPPAPVSLSTLLITPSGSPL